MDWRTDWLALHDRIAGIERALELFLSGLKVQSEDPYAVRRKVFRPEFNTIVGAVRLFRSSHARALPGVAVQTLDRFLAAHGTLLENTELDNTGHTVACVTTLSAFRTELGFHLVSRDAAWLRVTERAFEHLQRLIVADESVAVKWNDAFAAGEVACERLGAAHLLQHGIWAFKVSGAGERTDLIYNEPLSDLTIVAGTADTLVLTEWKVVRTPAESAKKIAAAINQVDLYSRGVLAGIELAGSRFIVIVSRERLSLPGDTVRDGITYRIRGIAVAPATPSKASQ